MIGCARYGARAGWRAGGAFATVGRRILDRVAGTRSTTAAASAGLERKATRSVIQNLYENVGGGLAGSQYKTSWYDYIQAVGVSSYDGKATVRTALYGDADAITPAASICRAAIAAGAPSGRVTDANGGTLAECP